MPFPINPTSGQVYTDNAITPSRTYSWDATDKAWRIINPVPAGIKLDELLDVAATAPVDGAELRYDLATTTWQATAPSKYQLLNGGSGFGRAVIKGAEILRSGDWASNVATRPHAMALWQQTNSSITPFFQSGGTVASWLKFYDGPGQFVGLTDQGVVYNMGDDSVGQMGSERATVGVDHRYGLKPVLDANIYGATKRVIDIFCPNVSTWDGPGQGQTIAVVMDDGTGTYSNYIWGWDNYRTTGTATSGNKLFPTLMSEIPAGRRIVKAWMVSGTANMVVLDDGSVWGVGYNANGALGDNTTVDKTQFTQAKLASGLFVSNAVDVIYNYSINTGTNAYILLSNGDVLSSGSNGNRQLGDGTNVQRTSFVNLLKAPGTPLTNIVKMQVCYAGALFLDRAGDVYHVGNNNHGVRGDGTSESATSTGYATVCQQGVADFWTSCSPRGFDQAFYRKTGNITYAAGSNVYGALGHPTTNLGNLPSAVEMPWPSGEYPVQMKRVGQVSEGGTSFNGYLALTNKGRVFGWGKNNLSVSLPNFNDTISSPQLIHE